MPLIVQKFGGTSVGTPERIHGVADRIARAREAGHDLIVVVSAMGHTTDEMIELAHQVSSAPPAREMDMLLTAGERISMALLSMALADRGVPALSFTGSQSGIITTQNHRRARIRRILGDRVRDAIRTRKVAIVAGFQGVSETKEITTLGRGGSDTSAVALAIALGAELCEIYTDVDGVYSADPRLVPTARLWPRISHEVMVELATRGAGVLHPRSVELAHRHGMRLCVRNSLNDSKGTQVVKNDEVMEEMRVGGVTADVGKVLVSVELGRPSALGAIWDASSRLNVPVVAPTFADSKVRFFTDRDAMPEWKRALDELSLQGFLKGFEIDPSLVPLSVVGDRFAQDGTALRRVVETLARHEIWVTIGSASALAITVAVPATHADDGVKALHQEFFG